MRSRTAETANFPNECLARCSRVRRQAVIAADASPRRYSFALKRTWLSSTCVSTTTPIRSQSWVVFSASCGRRIETARAGSRRRDAHDLYPSFGRPKNAPAPNFHGEGERMRFLVIAKGLDYPD